MIVPTRNESENVGPLVALLDGVLAEHDMEVIFVDDSDDGTDAVVREIVTADNRDVVLIHRERDQRSGGLGGAVVAGLRAARAPWACVMDADLQHPPGIIADLFDRVSRGDVDIVLASRFCGGGRTGEVGPLRRLLSRVSTLAAERLFAEQLRGVTDPMSGFFMVRREAVDADALRPQGFKILLEILVRTRGLRKAEVPFVFGIRHSGESKSGAKECARYLKQLWALRNLPAGGTLTLDEENARLTSSEGGRPGWHGRFIAPLIRAPAVANGGSVAPHSAARSKARLRRRPHSARDRERLTAHSRPWLHPLIDLALLYLTVAAAAALQPAAGDGTLTHSTLLLAYPLLVVAVAAARGVYTRRTWTSSLDATGASLVASVVATMVYVTVTTLAGVPADDMLRVLDAALLATAAVCATTGGQQLLRRWARRTGRSSHRALIVGAGVVGARVATRLSEHPEYGLEPVGMLDAEPGAAGAELPVSVVGRPQQVVETAAAMRAEHVILAFTRTPDRELVELVRRCGDAGLEVSLVPRLFESVNERCELQCIGTLPLMALRNVDPKGWQFTLKYALDRIVAAVFLVALAPLMLAVAAAVKLTSPGPVLFRQRRIGLDGQDFVLLKFRSMYIGDDSGFNLDAGVAPGGVEGTDRRTPIGKLLRRTFVDELPQLLNVLRGEMSLIGPRPERPEFVALFSDAVNRYSDRHRIKSGVTGWAQVHGLRGQTSLADRIELDNHYIDNWSAAMDLKILAMTVTTFVSNGWDA